MKEIPETAAVRPQRMYKDTLFRMLFRKKETLLSLYNAVNKTAYTDPDRLEITTLENAVYMNYKNDISFVMNFELLLYEHQSTVNPNMPLRHLFYVAHVLQSFIHRKDLYASSLVKIPTPKFVVFYNGKDEQPAQKTFRLSDAFEKKLNQPELELVVSMYNINLGWNPELLNACQTLKEYAQYVNKVREAAKTMPFAEAVETAVDYCIQNDILSDFLLKNRSEAIAVSIFEYDEEKHLKNEREYAYSEGRQKGLEEGITEGIHIIGFILKGIQQNVSKEDILLKLQQSHALNKENAEMYYEKAAEYLIKG